ncbi:ArnT family glycosyltransferase [Arthrobacter sp. NPDC090010]|uniref:ArnT family glycosyltransferase n=1 Tax=Arthrobacter sp. NPDC090010 TaxID=3363942 RepID=UPI003809BEB0
MTTTTAASLSDLRSLSTSSGSRRRWGPWPLGVAVLALAAAALSVWGVWAGSRSEYYASIALSMSQNWHNFFFGSFDPAGTVTLDKIPGSFWIPALFIKVMGFSTFSVILPNALASVAATLLLAFTAKRVAGPFAGLVAGSVLATTPILVAVSRSNQPETFFVLGLALTAWAAVRAVQQNSFRWLLLAGLFVAVSFQTYMLEAWAIWPALAAAYLCTPQPWLRKLWHTAVAGVVSLGASLLWIVAVAMIPASDRPYVGSTLHNDPWEMVFGYNGLGRFGESTADSTAYNSFTPPFSGSAGVFRLFNSQLAGQIAWLLPASVLAVVVLFILGRRAGWKPALPVFLGTWILTFFVMFSAVAGMHQFYTAALGVPIALTIGLAVGLARSKRVAWPLHSLLGVAVVTAIGIALVYGGYSIPVALVQAVLALGAVAALLWEKRRGSILRFWTAALVLGGLLLTPAVWSAVTLAHPNSINPVAGGVDYMGGGIGGGRGSFQGGPGAGGQNGFPGTPPGTSGSGNGTGFQGGPGGFPGSQQGISGGTSGTVPGSGTGRQFPGAGGTGGAGSMEGTASAALISYLEANKGTAQYLVATFGAQEAAGIITGSGGQSVLPVGGFSGNDPVPTVEQFKALVSSGALKYVLLSGSGMGGGMGGGQQSSGTSSEIRSWVQENCTAVTASGVSGLYACTASGASTN